MSGRLESWVASANQTETSFPLNNLPCGVFSRGGDAPRCCTAIGDQVLDLARLQRAGLLDGLPAVFDQPSWNGFMAAGTAAWSALRQRLTGLLSAGAAEAPQLRPALVPLTEVQLHLPFTVAEYTDFFSSEDHARNAGMALRGADTLAENWVHIPVGYNGRASTVVVSGTPVRRPLGQVLPAGATMPVFAASARVDFELELGAVVGLPNRPGEPVTLAEAEAMIFGYVLLNDWSARDIQGWENRPLGPFQSKGFATSIGAWIVTREALAAARCAAPARHLPLLPYLDDAGRPAHFDIDLTARLSTSVGTEAVITRTNYRRMYFSLVQQLCHHAANGCAMRTGDLIGSGTVSGPTPENRGCLLELTWNGRDPLHLPDATTRTYLEDGDTLTLSGHADCDGYRIGFGECAGTITAALAKSG